MNGAVTIFTRINDEIMDIYRIETASLGTNRANDAIIDNNTNDEIPEVSFDSGPEFNLNFFGMCGLSSIRNKFTSNIFETI